MSRRYLLAVAMAIILVSIFALFFEVVGLVSYGLIIIASWLAIVSVAIWLLLRLLSVLGLLNRRFSLRAILKVALMLLLAGGAGIVVMNIYAPPALPSAANPPGEQLRTLYETDQGDRLALRFRQLGERDRLRLRRTMDLLDQGAVVTPEDQYHAAIILQHGTESEHFERAYELAKEASDAGHEAAGGLWQSAYDRWQISMGQPQVYGTQSTATLTLFGISFQQQ